MNRKDVIDAYIQEYDRLIELERQSQKDAALQEIRTLSAKERERVGRAVSHLQGRTLGQKFDLWIVRFGRNEPIQTEISSGDVVLVSRGDPLKSDLQATVMRVGKHYLEVAFAQRPPKWIKQRHMRIDLFVNDVVFKRMHTNLLAMPTLQEPYASLRDIILDLKPAPSIRPVSLSSCRTTINDAQRIAIEHALGNPALHLIHGPPGTGKTTTLVELILQYKIRNKRVLACADSNVAVDNLLQRLARYNDLRLVRIGHPARIDPALERYTLAAQLETHPSQSLTQTLKRDIDEALKIRDTYIKPTQSKLRGLSKERVRTLAEKGKSMRGIDVETMRSMAAWIEADRRVETLFLQMNAIEKEAIDDIIANADVVCATNAMVGSETMQDKTFDIAVIDEAGQQIEPSTLLPLFRAPSVVLAGDHKQLPPTVISDNDILKRSLFERLMLRSDVASSLLNVQYRMHRTIMAFPNLLMYEGKLKADASVAERTLNVHDDSPLFDGTYPLVFINTNTPERLPPRSTSYENEGEANAAAAFVEGLVKRGVSPEDIGIITPYAAQSKRIRRLLDAKHYEEVEVKSVDGFQGREKEVIVVSLVRNNVARAIGFVSDARRLNVAMTRARRKLVILGNRATLEPNAPYTRFFSWLDTVERTHRVALINNATSPKC